MIKKALSQISKSPFPWGIEKAKLPRQFHQPTFTIYNDRTDSVEHVSQFKQKMTIHSQDEALMCRVFLSSLGPMAMRKFDGLRTNSISSFKKLTQAFCSRFITCNRVPQPLDSLLSMSMKEGESVKAYSDRYWEMFNEIDGDFDDVAIKTFKVGLPFEHDLRKSLTDKPVTNLRQLMDRVDKYKSIEDNQQQGKKGRLRLSLRKRGISGRTNTIITGREGIMQDNQCLPIPKRLMQFFESRSGKFQRRLRTNYSSNGQTKSFTAITIRNRDTLRKTVGTCGIIWTRLSEKEN